MLLLCSRPALRSFRPRRQAWPPPPALALPEPPSLNRRAPRTTCEQIGECVGTWWRPNYDTVLYPYLPPHVTRPKEARRLFIVPLLDRCCFAVGRGGGRARGGGAGRAGAGTALKRRRRE